MASEGHNHQMHAATVFFRRNFLGATLALALTLGSLDGQIGANAAACPAYQGCDAHSLDRDQRYELEAMERSWKLRDAGLLNRADTVPGANTMVFTTTPTSAHRPPPSSSAASGGSDDPCLRFRVEERPLKTTGWTIQYGGTSLYALSKGAELRMCAVANFFNGTYEVRCLRPPPGTCATVTVTVEFEHFRAFHNDNPGGGVFYNDSGGFRGAEKGELILDTVHCELAAETPSPPPPGSSSGSGSTTTTTNRGSGWVSTAHLYGASDQSAALALVRFNAARWSLVHQPKRTFLKRDAMYTDPHFKDAHGHPVGAWVAAQRASRGQNRTWDALLTAVGFKWGVEGEGASGGGGGADGTAAGASFAGAAGIAEAPLSDAALDALPPALRLAEWQDEWVWRDGCGALQQPSRRRSEEYRRCFAPTADTGGHRPSTNGSKDHGHGLRAPRPLVDFVSDSHLAYMSFCLSEEILHLQPYQTDWNKVGLRSLHELGRDGLYGDDGFFAGEGAHRVPPESVAASRAALARFKAEPRVSFIPWHTVFRPATMRCFLDPVAPGSPPGAEAEARACHFWVASLGAAAANLDALRLRAPRGREAPWGRERVAVFMLGHWDSAAQRDPRGLLLEELPSFLASVRRAREDPHTAGMRIVMDFPGPISPGRSTGWRNEFALGASAAFIRREVSSEAPGRAGAGLRVELLEPSFLAATMTRRSGQTSDETHFMKHAAFGKHYIGPRPPGLERTDPRTGDGRFCSGNVGEAFSRLLLDFLCDDTEAEEQRRGAHNPGGGAEPPGPGGRHHDRHAGSGGHGSGGLLSGGQLGGGARHHYTHHGGD